MKKHLILSALTMFVGLNAFAQVDQSIMVSGLKKVDQFDCDIEVRGTHSLRLLTTGNNKTGNRFLDLNLADSNFKLKGNENGWLLSREINLADAAINPLFAKFLYGKQITKVQYSTTAQGKAELIVSYTASTMAAGSSMHFKCTGTDQVSLDKRNACPSCLSSQN